MEKKPILSPAFTGDLLFHERLDILLKRAYSIQNTGESLSLASIITNILAEIYRYMDQEKAKRYRANLKEIKSELVEFKFRTVRVVTSNKQETQIINKLEDILFDLVVFAHEAKLILRDKGGLDDAFGDI